MKNLSDFELEAPSWLIDEWFPLGHRGMDTAPEGSFKTMLGCWFAVCIAAGKPIFGREVYQGKTMIIDEETPPGSLDNIISRFCKGLGVKFADIPLYRFSMEGFRFGRKTELAKMISTIKSVKPVFIRMDSLLAMIPTGKAGFGENHSGLGEIIRDDLTALLQAADNKCSIMLSAHSKKSIAGMTLDEVLESDMQSMVRGHGSIVGEGCDTGFVIHKETNYPDPTRFSFITKPRRQGIPMAKHPALIELLEEKYAEGWAKLEMIDNSLIPPSEYACSLYSYFSEPAAGGGYAQHTSEEVVRKHAYMTKPQIRQGINELFKHKVVINGTKAQTLKLNENEKEIAGYYLDILKKTRTI